MSWKERFLPPLAHRCASVVGHRAVSPHQLLWLNQSLNKTFPFRSRMTNTVLGALLSRLCLKFWFSALTSWRRENKHWNMLLLLIDMARWLEQWQRLLACSWRGRAGVLLLHKPRQVYSALTLGSPCGQKSPAALQTGVHSLVSDKPWTLSLLWHGRAVLSPRAVHGQLP